MFSEAHSLWVENQMHNHNRKWLLHPHKRQCELYGNVLHTPCTYRDWILVVMHIDDSGTFSLVERLAALSFFVSIDGLCINKC